MSPTKFDYAEIASRLTGVTSDSRVVQKGYLFAAIKGASYDGHEFINDAIQAGACVILTEDQSSVYDGVEVIRSKNVRQDFACLAAAFYSKQPEHIAAVTGTNGKTSVAYFVNQIWKALGCNSDMLGTLSGNLTTADPVSLHEHLKEKADRGVTHLIMEASSHGLDQHRLDGVSVQVAAFTNLSRDHLDYHGDMAHYLDAKSRLFSDIVQRGDTAVLNADIQEYQLLTEICNQRDLKLISYGHMAKDIQLQSCQPSAQGLDITVSFFGNVHSIALPLIGEFQAMNVLCAVGIVAAYLPDRLDEIVECLHELSSVPGRLQSIKGHPKKAGIYVDFAHTPDALETVLKSVRPHCSGQVWCVFGAGGDRDAGKRKLMGDAAAQFADSIVVTDDNPRSEDPALIRGAIMQGAPIHAENIQGRKNAIQYAIDHLEKGDVLIIAGKGHEQGQIFADHIEPFDDAEEARTAISNCTQTQNSKEGEYNDC